MLYSTLLETFNSSLAHLIFSHRLSKAELKSGFGHTPKLSLAGFAAFLAPSSYRPSLGSVDRGDGCCPRGTALLPEVVEDAGKALDPCVTPCLSAVRDLAADELTTIRIEGLRQID